MLEAVAVPRSLAEAHAALGERGASGRRRHRRSCRSSTRGPTRSRGWSACATPASGRCRSRTGGRRLGAAATLADLEAEPELAFLAPALQAIASPTIRNMATVGRQPLREAALRRPRGLPDRARRGRDGLRRRRHREPCRSRRWRRTGVGRRRDRHRRSPSPCRRRRVPLPQGRPQGAERGGDRHRRRRRSRSRTAAWPPAGSPSAASRPGAVRAPSAEAALTGRPLDRAAAEEAGRRAVEDIDPFDDAHASAWYRRRVTPVHVRRALIGE